MQSVSNQILNFCTYVKLNYPYTLYFILGFVPLSTRNLITSDQRNQFLPVIEALSKVMETNRPSTQDVNNLLDVTRNLLNKTPK